MCPALPLSDPAVDQYNMRVGTQTFSGRYKFTTNTLLVETAQAITNLGSDTIKFYLGGNTNQTGVPRLASVTNLLMMVRDEPSYHQVFDMPFRHFIVWTYPLNNPDAPFQDGNYTPTEQAIDYREMYDLVRYFLTNYNNSGKTFYLGHWEGDGYLSVNNWSTNPPAAEVSAMIQWENNRQQAVDDAKAATTYSNVSVYYYAEANRVRDAMLNGTNNNVRMINAVIPYVTNLDYISYSSYDAQNLSQADLHTTLDYMENHFPTNKAGKVPGCRMWIGEYGWGYQSTAAQEPLNRSYIQRLLSWDWNGQCLPFILFWEMYNNETNTDGSLKNYCLINANTNKVESWYLHQRFLNQAHLLVAQFKERNGRLPTDLEFSSLTSPFLDQVLPAPVSLSVANLGATPLSSTSARVSGTLAQGVYGDDRATLWVYYGRQDGGTVRSAWEAGQLIALNPCFSPATFSTTLAGLAPQSTYFYRFYATNASGEAWAPAASQFSLQTLNPADYGCRLKLTFSGYNRSETLTNFPVLVTLATNLPGFSYRQFASRTGGDLRFTDAGGSLLLPHEIDEWNTNGTSRIWVRVPQLSGPGDCIWAYWGNPAAAAPPAWTTNGSVWSADHFLVWHLKESGFPYVDSAQESPALSLGQQPPTSTSGLVGLGCAFNGSSQYLTSQPLDLGNAFTLSALLKLDTTATNIQTIWANKSGGWNSDGFGLYVDSWNTADKQLRLETGHGVSGSSTTTGTGAVSFGQWHHVAAAVDRTAGTARLYVDGVDCTQSSGVTSSFDNQGPVNLGLFTNTSYYFKGILDEVRIESTARSANWIWANYMTMAANASLATPSTVSQQAPPLSLSTGTNGLSFSWPGSGIGFSLYTATNLTPPIVWTAASNQPALDSNYQWQVTLPPTNAAGLFYRLQSP